MQDEVRVWLFWAIKEGREVAHSVDQYLSKEVLV